MRLIKTLLTLVFFVCLAWVGLTCYSGYSMYRDAIEKMPLEEKVEQVISQENFTELSELPPVYLDAILAVEDRNFYSHHGLSVKATARAVVRNFQEKELVEGGSTITQQLSKIWYFDLDKKFDRKVAELLMAFKIENNYEKDDILEFYLNSIYFGSGYYNVYDAAHGYFDKEPIDMDDYEATLLAGIPNAPSVYSPDVNPDLAEQRRRQVIACMVEYGYIKEGEIQ